MTDNTNIEGLPELPEPNSYCTHADTHEYDVFTADQMREYGLLCRRAALSNAEPVMELTETGWDLSDNLDPDLLESLPHGTKLFLHPKLSNPIGEMINNQVDDDGNLRSASIKLFGDFDLEHIQHGTKIYLRGD